MICAVERHNYTGQIYYTIVYTPHIIYLLYYATKYYTCPGLCTDILTWKYWSMKNDETKEVAEDETECTKGRDGNVVGDYGLWNRNEGTDLWGTVGSGQEW